MQQREFRISANYQPAGDQPEAIEQITEGIKNGLAAQVLLGVTGSGKTFTMANVVAQLQRPAVVLAHNKTLAAQLYSEFRDFFPDNSVEYFVSYYDYYQPEAYVAASDTYIEKDSSINEHIEQMRLSATKALLERRDTLVVATVSSIYGLGDPNSYMKMLLHLSRGEIIDRKQILRRLAELQYQRNDTDFRRATFRARGEVVDIYPADSDAQALRVELLDDEVEQLSWFDPLTGEIISRVPRATIYPKTHYATPRHVVVEAVDHIRKELVERLEELRAANRLVEAQRLEQRTRYDIEMLTELGFCNGVENYSRFFSGRKAGEPPPTLYDYLPEDALVFVDESHMTLPQLRAMYRGDRSRKENLVEFGFRLPSALDNRPLRFDEWEKIATQSVFLSATPGDYEHEHAGQVVEQVVRPTGLVDPQVEVRPASTQVEDLMSEVTACVESGERVLVTVLTKRMAEQLNDYLNEHQIRARYLHSDVDTVERVEILRDLRLGKFDVLVGINLLREGLDLPEVSLVAIFDADKEGFLRSGSSLVQTIGRAARHINGRAIMYADKVTGSMQRAMDETQRRREMQVSYNKKHNITPRGVQKKVSDILQVGETTRGSRKTRGKKGAGSAAETRYQLPDNPTPGQVVSLLQEMEETMFEYAKSMEFEKAAEVRDRIAEFKGAGYGL